MDRLGLDAVIFPAVADIGPADADVNPASADLAWRNGTWVANGNLAIRHLGIPTVTVPMVHAGPGRHAGRPDSRRSRAYDDERLLCMAGDFERATQRRTSPTRTPELVDDVFSGRSSQPAKAPPLAITLAAEARSSGDQDEIAITLDLPGDAEAENASVKVHVNGEPVAMQQSGTRFSASTLVPAAEHKRFHSVWRGSYGSIVTAVVRLEDGRSTGAYVVTGGIG